MAITDHMSLRRHGLAALLLFRAMVTAPAAAQSPALAGGIPANAPEISTREEPARFRAGVNLVLVPVVVRDGEGRIVGTLHKEDFQLFDKGKPVVITRFSAESLTHPVTAPADGAAKEQPALAEASKPLPTLPDRFVAYVFDDVHLSFGDLARARTAAVSQFSGLLTPLTRVAVFTTSGRIRQDFTNDRDLLQATIDRIVPAPNPALSDNKDCPSMTLYQANLIINNGDAEALKLAADQIQACNPILSPQEAMNEARLIAQRVLNGEEYEIQATLKLLEDVVQRLAATPGSRNIVLISSGFELTGLYRSTEDALIDKAIKANVTINALDARGLYAAPPGGDASRALPGIPGNELALAIQYESISNTAKEDLLSELAEGTGGAFFRHSNALDAGLAQLTRQPDVVYVLGFSPQNLKYDGSFHGLKVEVKNPPGLALQVRRGYYAPRHSADPKEAVLDELREALFSREEQRDIPVDLNLQFFKSSEGNARLAVIARVDLRPLHFRKADGRNLNTLKIVAGLFDRNGTYISAIESTLDIRLFDETLAKLPASGISVRSNFDLAPGDYSVRVVVRDTEGEMMTARNGVIRIP